MERIHSNLSQVERIKALQGFREGEHRILVATDIAARGIDVPRVRHIINFEMPETVMFSPSTKEAASKSCLSSGRTTKVTGKTSPLSSKIWVISTFLAIIFFMAVCLACCLSEN